MKKIVLVFIAVGVVLVVGYLYATRAVVAPSVPIGDASAKMPDGTPRETGMRYRIVTGSSATFSIYELLNGKDKTVVGTTSDIGGDIRIVDGALEIGTITINARTFKTDSEKRDGAIGRFVLKSESPENEFITFVPSGTATVSGKITEGKEFSFSVLGELTISGISKPAVFSGTATYSDSAIVGTVETKLSRSLYGIVIPNLSFIANIPDEFTVGATIKAERIAI